MNETGWFACDEGTDSEVPDPRYPWQPVLQLDGGQARLGIWFTTEAECLTFIERSILGQGLYPAA